jgi:hypothetical protein
MDFNEFFDFDEKKEIDNNNNKKLEKTTEIEFYSKSLSIKDARLDFANLLSLIINGDDEILKNKLKKCFLSLQLKSFVVRKLKKIYYYDELNDRDKHYYTDLIKNLKTDDKFLELKNKIDSLEISGRQIEETLIKYPKHFDPVYYLDYTHDKENPSYSLEKTETNELFNFERSYRSLSTMFEKKYFDPFGRGIEIYHVLKTKNNQKVHFSLCRFYFYKWAFKHKFTNFVKDKIEVVSQLKKMKKARYK